jgi:CheY-like chemotaxis protein
MEQIMPEKNLKESSSKKILLAEDDGSMRRFLEITLQRLNYEVLSAEDGLAAMKIALETDVDGIVADAVMPNLTGYDLCRMLRQNTDKKHIPFIILSGFEQNADAESCLADAYLTKDKDITEQLEKTLSGFFGKKS